MIYFEGVSIVDLNLWRSVMSLILNFLIAKHYKVSLFYIPKELRPYMIVRAINGQIGFICLTAAILLIPLGQLIVLFNTNPLFTSLFALYILGEPI